MSRAGWTIAIATTIGVVALVGGVAASGWTPSIPADAASTVIARTALEGEIAPDAPAGGDPEAGPRSPAGSDCLAIIERPAGAMSACWEAYRDPMDADPTQDYYRLRVFGTFDSGRGTGVRWAVLGARLVGAPSNQVFETWPEGRFEGPCRQVEVSIVPGNPATETLCGRTIGTTDVDTWSHRVTWTCVGCLIPDGVTRAITLYEWLAVPAGTVPTWEIFADLGG